MVISGSWSQAVILFKVSCECGGATVASRGRYVRTSDREEVGKSDVTDLLRVVRPILALDCEGKK